MHHTHHLILVPFYMLCEINEDYTRLPIVAKPNSSIRSHWRLSRGITSTHKQTDQVLIPSSNKSTFLRTGPTMETPWSRITGIHSTTLSDWGTRQQYPSLYFRPKATSAQFKNYLDLTFRTTTTTSISLQQRLRGPLSCYSLPAWCNHRFFLDHLTSCSNEDSWRQLEAQSYFRSKPLPSSTLTQGSFLLECLDYTYVQTLALPWFFNSLPPRGEVAFHSWYNTHFKSYRRPHFHLITYLILLKVEVFGDLVAGADWVAGRDVYRLRPSPT